MATEDKCDIIIAMLEELKSGNKNQKSQQMDFSKVESLSEKLESSINATSDTTVKMEGIMEEVRKPVIRERRFTIDIVSKEITFLLVGMGLVISVLGSALYFGTRPNYDRIDNDLKYRYIKMKGEATPERISELEDLFEINRDNTKIRQMSKDVEEYEQAVKEKATLDEQNRLRQVEAEKLKHETEKLRKNNGHKAAATNFLNALDRIPKLMEQYQTENAKLEKDLPTLREIVSGTWKKEDELKELKSEVATLERKIQFMLAPP